MAYELLVLDVDGTLVNTKKEITERLDLTSLEAMLFRLMVDALQILQPVK